MLLHAVGPPDFELGIGHEILVQKHRRRVGEVRVVRVEVWPGAVFAGAEEGVLEVVREKFEPSMGASPIASAKPVIRRRTRSAVEISHPEIEEEEVDKVVHVEQYGVCG